MPLRLNQLAIDNFPYANGDLHTANANWIYGVGNFAVSSNKCYSNANPCIASRSDVGSLTDQYAQAIVLLTVGGGTQNCGPAVRCSAVAATAYIMQLGTDLTQLSKYVSGVNTVLVTTGGIFVTGDSCTLVVIGTFLTVLRNGAPLAAFTNISDASIASGNIGQFGAGIATSNGISLWSGGTAQNIASGDLGPGFDLEFKI